VNPYQSVRVNGHTLRRKVAVGPRGGVSYIYQHVDDCPSWGYWCCTARQAIADRGDTVVAGGAR
jgi:hypothetical protein